MPEAKVSRERPLPGYRYFLNQRFRLDFDYFKSPNKPHEIDFPYTLCSPVSISKILTKTNVNLKQGIFVDKDSRNFLDKDKLHLLEKYGPVRYTGGSIDAVLKDIERSKYFLRLGNRGIWGNATIEVAACETLLINSPRGLANNIFSFAENTTKQIDFNDAQFAEALSLIELFESDDDLYMSTIAKTSNICHEICYLRPISKLFQKKYS